MTDKKNLTPAETLEPLAKRTHEAKAEESMTLGGLETPGRVKAFTIRETTEETLAAQERRTESHNVDITDQSAGKAIIITGQQKPKE
jgi:hypothetical protein